ncbi:immunoglobulin E-set [Radiomyces spectabilis]|uniref:immunoglobulin E-set n=1 Tax=Radiomyces spectabilis TaxID=64574 RepID=UPI00221E9E3C|nr:immunoglobulin E-set [Radiomyces spectabilis]KAI8374179.1 immunoglobulin E-set [Radiomyces spectabilis]
MAQNKLSSPNEIIRKVFGFLRGHKSKSARKSVGAAPETTREAAPASSATKTTTAPAQTTAAAPVAPVEQKPKNDIQTPSQRTNADGSIFTEQSAPTTAPSEVDDSASHRSSVHDKPLPVPDTKVSEPVVAASSKPIASQPSGSTNVGTTQPVVTDATPETNQAPVKSAKQSQGEPHLFKWVHGGKEVYLTGSFDNWAVSIPMERSQEDPNIFQAQVSIDETSPVSFKFVVDGEWRFAEDLPHETDAAGNVNNVVRSVTL